MGDVTLRVPAFERVTLRRPWASSIVKFTVAGTYGEILGERIGTGEVSCVVESPITTVTNIP